MNAIFAFLLAGTLHTAAPVKVPVSNPTTTYVVSEHAAVWVTSDQKMHVVLERNGADAEVQLSDESTVYLRQRIDLRDQAVNQRYDLSALPTGTYQLTIKTKDQVIRKTVTVRTPAVERLVTLG